MSNHVKSAFRIAELALDSLETIQRLTHFGGEGATAALASISNIVGVLQDGIAGKSSPADVERELAELKTHLADNDSAADAALRQKFDR